MAEGGVEKVLDNPPMYPKNRLKAQNPAKMIRRMYPKFIKVVYNKLIMMKALFLILCLFLPGAARAGTPVEIYANGHKYDSLQAYQASKAMTLDVASASTMRKLYVLSVEKGVAGALQNFYQTFWAGSDFYLDQRIYPDQMQEAIRKAVTATPAPKLLISESGKVRILTLDRDEIKK